VSGVLLYAEVLGFYAEVERAQRPELSALVSTSPIRGPDRSRLRSSREIPTHTDPTATNGTAHIRA
jgi:hypothetical protein